MRRKNRKQDFINWSRYEAQKASNKNLGANPQKNKTKTDTKAKLSTALREHWLERKELWTDVTDVGKQKQVTDEKRGNNTGLNANWTNEGTKCRRWNTRSQDGANRTDVRQVRANSQTWGGAPRTLYYIWTCRQSCSVVFWSEASFQFGTWLTWTGIKLFNMLLTKC